MTPEEIDHLLKLIQLGQLAFLEALKLIQNHQAQKGLSTEEILAHAEAKNNEAKLLIDSL